MREQRTRARTTARRGGACALALALAGWLTAATGQTLEEDYQQGAKAYQIGDLPGAFPALKRAADAGHAPAQAMLADMLDLSEFDEQAVDYYRKSAEQGNAEGQYGLGKMTLSGEGVERDLTAGRGWITKAAEQGHAQAIRALAMAYIKGGLDLSESDRRGEAALRWISRAAEIKYAPAIDELALAYREGKYGLTPDPARAEQFAAQSREIKGVRQTGKRKKKNAG